MSAIVVVMPVVARPAFDDAAWREQYARECAALCAATIAPPPRTRPLKVIDNDKVVAIAEGPQTAAAFEQQMCALRDALNRDDQA
ncbi:hypothetical protein ACWX0K_10855 [Nitrobacteraceae bacterium UC4446_H13]